MNPTYNHGGHRKGEIMRPIKFRVFINGKFYYWGIEPGSTTWWLQAPPPSNISMAELDQALQNSQQFTGLLDSEGTEIYEGDILKWVGLVFPITIDTFHGYRFMFGKDQLCKAYVAEGKIIGNVDEDPGLANDQS